MVSHREDPAPRMIGAVEDLLRGAVEDLLRGPPRMIGAAGGRKNKIGSEGVVFKNRFLS